MVVAVLSHQRTLHIVAFTTSKGELRISQQDISTAAVEKSSGSEEDTLVHPPPQQLLSVYDSWD